MTPFASRDLMVKVLDAGQWEACCGADPCSNDATDRSANPTSTDPTCEKAGERELDSLRAQLEETLAHA